ncbi:MAG: hypothetical protein QOI96_958 [Verrucomicrobiota bacterium]|jgi:uncharacterized membrane protein YqjE
MIGEATRFRGSAGHGGLLSSLLALVSALASFIESRLGLFATESKAALAQVLMLIVCVVGALLFFAIGYIFVIASAVVWLAHVAGVVWWWIALAAAGLHFIFALILLLIAKAWTARPLFPATTAELEKDRQWLKSLDGRSRPTN